MTSAIDPSAIQELFTAFGTVSIRRMFGGAGLYADGVMFALWQNTVIYLKADAVSAPAFQREGMTPFSYPTKTGSRVITSYWRMPERLYDDPDELATWAHDAMAAARRGAEKKKPGRASGR